MMLDNSGCTTPAQNRAIRNSTGIERGQGRVAPRSVLDRGMCRVNTPDSSHLSIRTSHTHTHTHIAHAHTKHTHHTYTRTHTHTQIHNTHTDTYTNKNTQHTHTHTQHTDTHARAQIYTTQTYTHTHTHTCFVIARFPPTDLPLPVLPKLDLSHHCPVLCRRVVYGGSRNIRLQQLHPPPGYS